MYKIRPLNPTDEEYGQVAEVLNTVWPEVPTTAERLRYGDDNLDPKYFHKHLVAVAKDVDEDRIVAITTFMEPSWSYRPGKYRIDIDVHPQWQGRGIGTASYNMLMETLNNREPKPTHLSTNTREDKPEAIRFFEKRGFQNVMRTPTSELDLTTFSIAKFHPLIERLSADGVVVRTLQELSESDAGWQQKLYDLDWEGTLDEPQPDTPTRMPFDEYVKRYLGGPEVLLDGWFIAIDTQNEDRYVGMSQVEKNLASPKRLSTGFSCVSRPYRRRGIATVLKAKGLQYAKEYGADIIRTGNEENNPMLQINLNLGFVLQPAWLAYEKRIA